MTRFNFDYEAVLRHRHNMEDLAQQELAKLLRERMVLGNQLRSLHESVREDRSAIAAPAVGLVDAGRVQRHSVYAGQAAVRGDQILARLGALDRRIEDARRMLMDAVKRRKAIERLHDKQLRRWHTSRRRNEQAELEEVGAAVAWAY